MAEAAKPVLREVVAVFHDAERLETAIDELQSSGFDRAEISLLASERTIEQKLGHRYERTSELMDSDDVPRSAFVSSAAIGDAKGGLIGGLAYVGATLAAGAVVVAGGALAATIAAALAAGGAGGLIGLVLANWVGGRHAAYLDEQMEHGGLLLWVRAWSAEDEQRASAVLGKHCAGEVHVHEGMAASGPASAPPAGPAARRLAAAQPPG
jgi:hypothetical protein